MILTVLFVLVSANIGSAFCSNGGSAQVDVFTQKEPYSGRGPNMPSDAFGPEDIVILYALLTQSDLPVESTIVGFDVKLPNDANFSLSARTNMSGIATVNFTMITPPLNVSESDIFGIWTVTVGVLLGGEVYQDTLSFKVDWIVKLLTVKTIDENLSDRDQFGRGGDVGLEITLRSIAMTLRNATIEILVKDEVGVPVNFSQIQDFAVPANEKVVFLYAKATPQKFAVVGKAVVFVSATTIAQNGSEVPYCPTISTKFTITGENPLEIDYHDVAVVAVLPSANTIQIGQGLKLETILRNEGTVAENFNVSTYFDTLLLGTSQVKALPPYSTAVFQFTIAMSLLTLGNHTISAHIPSVPHEADLTDNDFSNTIEVKSRLPSVKIHDIAVTDIRLSSDSVFVGEILRINVTVVNNGTEPESFELSTYYNSSLIETRQVDTLAPASQVLVTLSWNTSSVKGGLYQIGASAPLPDDVSPGDNALTDGFVQVKSIQYPPSILFLGVFILFMSIVAAIVSLIMLLMLCSLRRRKKKRLSSRYTIIAHPHI